MHGLHADLNTYACNFRASPACYLSVACGSTHALLLVSYSSFQCWGHCTYMLLVVDTRTLAVDVVPCLRSFRVIRVARVEPEGYIPPAALYDYWCVCKAPHHTCRACLPSLHDGQQNTMDVDSFDSLLHVRSIGCLQCYSKRSLCSSNHMMWYLIPLMTRL